LTVYERLLKSVNIWRSYRQESLGTVLLKDEELARDLEYDKKWLLFTTSILTWLRQLSNWCR